MDYWGTVLQLGIGGLAVGGIIYVTIRHSETMANMQTYFIEQLNAQAVRHEESIRKVEFEVRTSLTNQLTKNTIALSEVSHLMARVSGRLDK